MKIFSLQSKTSLVIWSVILGIFLSAVTKAPAFNPLAAAGPFIIYNFIFWILFTLIILYAIRVKSIKAFALGSKIALVLWSLIIGLVISFSLYGICLHTNNICRGPTYVYQKHLWLSKSGFPFRTTIAYDYTPATKNDAVLDEMSNHYGAWPNVVFWISAIFIVLVLIRRFGKKKAISTTT